MAFQEFAQSEDRDEGPADERTGEPAREESVPQGDLKGSSPQDILEENIRMPKLTLHKRVSEDEFRNKRRGDDLRDTVFSKVRGMASRFVTEYLAAKSEMTL